MSGGAAVQPLRLVLDTNVALDLFHFADAAVLPMRAAIDSGRVRCVACSRVLDEFERVLGYPRIALDVVAARDLRIRYTGLAEVVDDPPVGARLPRCADADDQIFLDLAHAAHADLLVSRDAAVLALARARGLAFRIVAPHAACAVIASLQG